MTLTGSGGCRLQTIPISLRLYSLGSRLYLERKLKQIGVRKVERRVRARPVGLLLGGEGSPALANQWSAAFVSARSCKVASKLPSLVTAVVLKFCIA